MGKYNESCELMHYGVLGMKWGVRRKRKADARRKRKADKKKAKMDARDLDYYRKTVPVFDLYSERSQKLAGKQIKARGKAWVDYFVASDGGKIHNEKTKALRKKYDEADLDMLNVLISDVRVPSGRTPRWTMDETGEQKLVFE